MSNGSELKPWATPPSITAIPEGTSGRVPPGVQAAGGAAPFMPTPAPGGGGVAAGFLRTVPPVLQVKPPSGVDFAPTGLLPAATAATTAGGVVVGTCTFTVPGGSVAYLRSFILEVGNLLPTSLITFSVRIDGASIPGMNALQVIPANLAVFILAYGPDEIFIEIPPGKVLEIAVVIADAGVYNLGASLHGWTVPQQTAEAFAQGWG